MPESIRRHKHVFTKFFHVNLQDSEPLKNKIKHIVYNCWRKLKENETGGVQVRNKPI